jgi:EAL and modified HD-GYP domain-containing signal transduction protein
MKVDRFVARQPIVGVDHEIVAFQLLQRPSSDARDSSGPRAGDTFTTSDLLGGQTLDAGQLVGDIQIFCEPGPGVLEGTTAVSRPSRPTVLEVPAERCADDVVVGRCHELVLEGYVIALDGFAWLPGIERLLEVADIVKIDLAAASREQVLDLVDRCRPHGVTLAATRCRTEDDLSWAAEAGFELFQGPVVKRPVELDGAALAPSALAQVQLAAELLDQRLDFGRVEEILSHEPGLVVQVLHQASLGAAGGLRREVHSVREALVLMGTIRLGQWAALAVLGRQVSNSPSDALATALVRARMCELLAPTRGIERGFAFTAGLLSALDRLLGIDISEVADSVDVDEALATAAFRRESPVGTLVGLVADYQDAVDAGESSDPALGDVELVAAMAFCWAMAHVNAIERAPARRAPASRWGWSTRAS